MNLMDKLLHRIPSRIILAEIGDAQIGMNVDAVEDYMRVPRSSLSPPPTSLTGERIQIS